ncbi:MAG: hypothetical protein A2X40_00025 [Elusimicrobia bacterium GWC2_65_9]|nr:MAG: hypothetical protein A2X37_12480 [Elusimicrobia bacterium GWA2_66_18]OGR71115.1 MAG: hypothetical protein A2X40_00025 [Elusimicrobia bacterium GWC2_65_9]
MLFLAAAMPGLISLAQVLPSEPDADSDPGIRELRDEFLRQRLGPPQEGYPADAHMKALEVARRLPISPLQQTKKYTPLSGGGFQITGKWTFPIPPPLDDRGWYGKEASQRIVAIAVHPSNANTVYVGGGEGGVAKSTDGGTHWTYISDSLDSQSIASIVIDPKAPNILYTGTGYSAFFGVGIYRSFDSGATWALLGRSQFSGKTIGKIAIDPATAGSQNTTTLYASVTANSVFSLWKSKDSGTTWTQIKSGSGAAWYGGSIYDIAIDPGASSTLYITAPDGVFRSLDAGGTWTKIHDIPDQAAASRLAFVQGILWLAYKNSSSIVVRSSDKGATWWAQITSPGNTESDCFAVDPARPNRIFIGGSGNLRYSTNNGDTWTQTDGSKVHVDMHAIAIFPGNTDTIYLGNDGGVYRSDDGGATWVNKNQNLSGALMHGISLSGDGHMIMGNQDNGTQVYTGGNTPWTMVYGGDGWYPKIDPNNSNKMYFTAYLTGTVSAYSGVPYRRENGSIKDVTPPGAVGEKSSFFPAMFMAPGNSNHIIIGFQNVWRSLDSGNTWTRIGRSTYSIAEIAANKTIELLYEAPSNQEMIYAYTKGGYLFVTANAGRGNSADWTNITDARFSSRGINTITVHPTQPDTAYVILKKTGNPHIYKTTDRGRTWTGIGAELPDTTWFNDIIIDTAAPNTLIAASASGIFSSLDSGATWGNMNAGIPAGMNITSLSMNSGNRQLVAATAGRGVYSTVLPSGAGPSLIGPSIISVGAASGTTGTAFSYQITATNNPTSFSAAGLPAGLSVNAVGVISGTPTSIGTFNVTISAVNSSGTGSSTLTLIVYSACDLNRDASTNVVDVQLQVNQALGVTACTSDLNRDGACNVVDVQRSVNASLAGQCLVGP